MIYLKFDSIKGSSTEGGEFKDWIPVQDASFGFGVMISMSTGDMKNRVSSRAQFQEISCSKATDLSTPELMNFALKIQIRTS